MLPSQRKLFDIPRDVCFLNAAAWSPLPLAVQEAGRAGVARKGQPWKIDAKFMADQYERARKAAAALIGAEPMDVALISSVGYGVSTAGKVLNVPRGSRVQYRVAQPGEVLNPGGIVLNLLDVGDVYMTFFLPTAEAGRVAIGSEVRLVLDAAPQYVIPAKVSFVADVAQFTPKTVETAEERQKLMFRVKAKIAPDLLQQYIRSVKTGLPGMAYVRLDEKAPWPDWLQTRLPAP